MNVPIKFQTLIPNNYPLHHRGKLIEDYAFEYFTKNPVKSNYTYLPVFWTGWFVSNNYGKAPRQKEIQKYVNTLPKNIKYWTIVQNDDGLFVENFPCKVFSCSSIGDYAIPLLCNRHTPIVSERNPYSMSFMGNLNTHPIRTQMVYDLRGDVKVSIKRSLSTSEYVKTMCRSMFALCPRGYGISSFRMYEAMALGTIPIYISDVHWLPFQNKIDWDKCAVLVEPKGMRTLSKDIRQIPLKRIQEMQNYIKEVSDNYFTFEGTCREISEIVRGM